MQYGRGSFALPILRDADVRDTDVCRNLRNNGGCVSHDARTAVGGEISKHARTCYSEYLQCAGATASGGSGYSVGIAHTLDSKCADTLKLLAGSGGRLSKSLWIGVSTDTPIESRRSHKGLPSDTVFFRLVT